MISALIINAIGDHYLALPAMRGLQARFPDDFQVIGVKGIASEVFSGAEFPRVRELAAEWSPGMGWRFDELKLRSWLRPSRVIASFCPWDSASLSAVIASLGHAHKVGFGERFDTRVPICSERHAFDQMFEIAKAIDETLNIEDYAVSPRLHGGGRRLKRSLQSGAQTGERLLVIHTETKPTKTWSVAAWTAFCRRVRAEDPRTVICLLDRAAPPDPLAEFFAVDAYAIHSGCLPISAASGLIAAAAWFIGVDSCFLHVADLHGIPTLGLFRSTRPEEFGPRFASPARSVLVRGDEPGCEGVWAAWRELLVATQS